MTCSHKRVLHLVESLNPKDGGPSKSVPSLYNARLCLGFMDLIATVHLSQCQMHREFANYSFRAYFGKLRISPYLACHIYRNRKNFEILHLNCIWNFVFILGFFMAFFLRKKIILSTRGMLRLEHIKKSKIKLILLNFFLLSLFKRVNCFHVTSEWERRNLLEIGINDERIKLIYNVDIAPCEKYDFDKPSEEDCTFTYLYVGRIHPYKRVIELIDAFSKLPEDIMTTSRLKLVGPQTDLEYLQIVQQRIDDSPRNADITLHGFKEGEELARCFQECKVFVMPSKSENFGMAILEALKLGKFVAVPEMSPWPEILPIDSVEVISKDASNLIDCLLKAKTKVSLNIENTTKIQDILQRFKQTKIVKQYTFICQNI